MPLRALFLDVGFTLLREEPPRHAIYAEVARAEGLDVDGGEMRARMGRAHRELPRSVGGGFRYSDPWFRAFIERIFVDGLALPRARLEAVTAELFRRFEDGATFRVYPGAVELLTTMRERGVTLGVVSNWSSSLGRVLAATGLHEHLDFVLASAVEGVEKPDPELFERALARAGVAARDALHAGDDPERDGGAARLGIEAVLVDHGGRLGGAVEPALRRVGSLGELRALALERIES